MIILDTNVVSAFMQREPDPRVIVWFNGVHSGSVWTTAITVMEIRFGIEILVPSRRRRTLEDAFEKSLKEELENRVLPFDEAAARAASSFAAVRRRAGRPAETHDVEIAGIVAAQRATLATRDVGDFEGLGLRIVNPWAS
ncbi:MAG: type II toxin-antitoxin system VapC family toxin [Bauldia sp.]